MDTKIAVKFRGIMLIMIIMVMLLDEVTALT